MDVGSRGNLREESNVDEGGGHMARQDWICGGYGVDFSWREENEQGCVRQEGDEQGL